jgi:hypothetical protein
MDYYERQLAAVDEAEQKALQAPWKAIWASRANNREQRKDAWSRFLQEADTVWDNLGWALKAAWRAMGYLLFIPCVWLAQWIALLWPHYFIRKAHEWKRSRIRFRANLDESLYNNRRNRIDGKHKFNEEEE